MIEREDYSGVVLKEGKGDGNKYTTQLLGLRQKSVVHLTASEWMMKIVGRR